MPRATSSTPPGTIVQSVDRPSTAVNGIRGQMFAVVQRRHPRVPSALEIMRFQHNMTFADWGVYANQFNVVEDPDARG